MYIIFAKEDLFCLPCLVPLFLGSIGGGLDRGNAVLRKVEEEFIAGDVYNATREKCMHARA